MIPEDLERQIILAEAEVSESSGWWGGPFCPLRKGDLSSSAGDSPHTSPLFSHLLVSEML
jgi:hypothetical protein